MDAYREPFRDPAARLPTLAWPRELPIEGEPADVVAIVEDYGRWLAKSTIPKLLISAEPGALLIGGHILARATLPEPYQTIAGASSGSGTALLLVCTRPSARWST